MSPLAVTRLIRRKFARSRAPCGNCFCTALLVIRLSSLLQQRPVQASLLSTCIVNIISVFRSISSTMDYEQRLRRLDTEENTELSDLRARVNLVDSEIETAMHEVRRFQNAIVRLCWKRQVWRKKKMPFTENSSTDVTSFTNKRRWNCVNVKQPLVKKCKLSVLK